MSGSGVKGQRCVCLRALCCYRRVSERGLIDYFGNGELDGFKKGRRLRRRAEWTDLNGKRVDGC